eukprot:scaffold382_cov138-Alexandrium_tamarense.AAC.3
MWYLVGPACFLERLTDRTLPAQLSEFGVTPREFRCGISLDSFRCPDVLNERVQRVSCTGRCVRFLRIHLSVHAIRVDKTACALCYGLDLAHKPIHFPYPFQSIQVKI